MLIASDGPRLAAKRPTLYMGSRGCMNLNFTVELREGAHHSGNWGGLLAHDVGGEALTIVTCDGDFNPATQEYSNRTVVRAVRTAF